MLISTKGKYALMIMTYLAEHQDEGAVSLKSIADEQEMGIKYLEIIVASLNKAGLLESCRGKNGGYRLNKSPEEYSLYEILTVAEGSLVPVNCVENGVCANAPNCKTNHMWSELHGIITDYLTDKKLSDIL